LHIFTNMAFVNLGRHPFFPSWTVIPLELGGVG